jgi:hypothetical protein
VLHRPDERVNRRAASFHYSAISLVAVSLLWWFFGAAPVRHFLAPVGILLGPVLIKVGLRLERKITYYPYLWIDFEGVHYASSPSPSDKQNIQFVPWHELSGVSYLATEGFSGILLERGFITHQVMLGYADAQKAMGLIDERIASRNESSSTENEDIRA